MYGKVVKIVIAINYSTARQNLKEICDRAVNDFETIIVTRSHGDNVVLISEGEYNNMIENLYLRSNPTYYNDLIESIQMLKKGKGKVRELKNYE